MNKSAQPLTLTGGQLKVVLSLSGLKPGEASPLSDVPTREGAPRLGPNDCQMLREFGWLEKGDPPKLTPKARAGLEALCHPNISANLLLGTREAIGTSHLYSARGLTDGALVSYAVDPERDEYRLLLGQSPGALADAMTVQVLGGPLDETVAFQATPEPVEFVALLSILDWRLHTLLAAMLDREPYPDIRFTAWGAWEMLVEGRTAQDLAWPVTLFTYLLPFLDYELDEETIETALQGLQEKGLVTQTANGRYTISDTLLELGNALLPVVSYAAMNVEMQGESGGVSGTHLAILRGRSVILLVQPVVDASGRRVLAMDTVDAVELAEILFQLGLPGQQLVQTPSELTQGLDQQTCPQCGAEIKPGRKFCTQCGASLTEPAVEEIPVTTPTAPPPVCPACGAEVKPGRKFCTQCGAPLAAPTGENGG